MVIPRIDGPKSTTSERACSVDCRSGRGLDPATVAAGVFFSRREDVGKKIIARYDNADLPGPTFETNVAVGAANGSTGGPKGPNCRSRDRFFSRPASSS
jgi:hypothetical protein